MKRLFIVTGANGFLGNNIIRQLEQNPENEIRALVLPNDKVHSLKVYVVKFITVMLRKRKLYRKFFRI